MVGEKNRAVFLDRDGTLIVDVGYPRDPAQVELLPGVGPALAELKRLGFLLVVVSNQSGIARGLVTQDEADRVHRRLEELLTESEASLAAAYYCPHGPEDGCSCRKPRPGMLLQAAADLDIDLAVSFMIGDKMSDAEAGKKAGCQTIVLRPDGQKEVYPSVDYFEADWEGVLRRIKVISPCGTGAMPCKLRRQTSSPFKQVLPPHPGPGGLARYNAGMEVTIQEVEGIVKSHVAVWNSDPANPPLWVVLASPGDAIQIPGVTFGNMGDGKAGMELPIRAQLIILNHHMVPESLLSTFLHEYGHAVYRNSQPKDWNEIDSEVEAIRYALKALADHGLDDLAYREAEVIKQMAGQEPYKSAVAKLADLELWRKYAALP